LACLGSVGSDGNSFIRLLAIKVNEEERVCDVLSYFSQHILAHNADMPYLHGRVSSSNRRHINIPLALSPMD
jgi:hypothetical protein